MQGCCPAGTSTILLREWCSSLHQARKPSSLQALSTPRLRLWTERPRAVAPATLTLTIFTSLLFLYVHKGPATPVCGFLMLLFFSAFPARPPVLSGASISGPVLPQASSCPILLVPLMLSQSLLTTSASACSQPPYCLMVLCSKGFVVCFLFCFGFWW